MDSTAALARSLPLFVSLPVIALVTALVLVAVRRVRSVAALFVVFAVWLRIVLAALHDFTFDPSPFGLSWNALGSVGAAGLGLFAVRRRRLFDPAVVPFYLLVPALVASGLVNGEWAPLATAMTKYAYLVVLILAVVDAAEDLGADRLLRLALSPFALVLLLQALSLALGVAKPGESDGAASYIGGFYHEAAFSVTLAAGVLALSLLRRVPLSARLFLIAVGLAGILIGNYRTAILAVLPLVGVVVMAGVPQRVVAAQRGLVMAGMAILVGAAGLGVAVTAGDRFADIGKIVRGEAVLIQRPEYFAEVETDVMSGRPLIWSQYYYGWADADAVRRTVGFGPETWTKHFELYAHNSLFNALYETGLAGTVALLFLWAWMVGLALLARGGPRLELLAAHLAFLLLNMATMPMWMIEGMIFYGLLCGVTVHYFKHRTGTGRGPARTSAAYA